MKYSNQYIVSAIVLLLISARGIAQEKQDSMANVVTFGPMQREAVTLIDVCKGDELRKRSVYSVSNSLYGMIPGLVVMQGNGQPGSDEASFLVRGLGTFGNSNDPIIIIDGLQGDISSLALEDIESVAVLKDAVAAVLYGYKAANGVIEIRTKRGRNGKSQLNANVVYGMQIPIKLPKFVSSAQYAEMYNQALKNDGLPILYSAADIEAYRKGDSNFYPNVDWMEEMLRKSTPQTMITANGSGGNRIVKYYASIGYLFQDGLYNHTNTHKGYNTNIRLNRLNFRSNLDIQLMQDWKLRLDAFGYFSGKNAPKRNADVWTVLNRYPSTIPMYVELGKLGGTPNYPSNPMSIINEQGYANTQNRSIQTTLSTEYDLDKIVRGLKVGARFGYNNYYTVTDGWSRNVEAYSLLPNHTVGEPIGKNTTLAYNGQWGDYQNLEFTFEAYANYNIQLNRNNRLSILGLYHQDKKTTGEQTPYKEQSISGLLGYQFQNRYLVDIGLNYAGVERFKKGDRFSLFPSASIAWIVSEEDFLKDLKGIDHLLLKFSTGKTGRSNFGIRYAYRDYYVYNGGYYFGDGGRTDAVVENTLSNPAMTYEIATSYAAAIQARFLRGFYAAATYFYQRRSNILVSRSNLVPSMIGAAMQPINDGRARNSGIELMIGYNRIMKDWSYSLEFNATHMSSKILYQAELPVPVGSEYNYHTGNPISQPYGLEFIGFFESEEDIKNSPTQQFGEVKPGDMKYKDRNGDGVVDKYDETAISSSVYPKWELGLKFAFSYKDFDLNGLLHSQMGRSIYLGNNSWVYWPLVNDAKISAYVNTPWTKENAQAANYPRLTTLNNPNNYRSSNFWYKKADFLRLRSLEVGYTFRNRSKQVPSFRVFFLGTNLFTLSNFTFSDPEIYTVGYPAMKSYNVGVNMKF